MPIALVAQTPDDAPSPGDVDAAIERATQAMLSEQSADGYWWSKLESNVTITAEYLLLTHFLGVADGERWRRITDTLRSSQLEDGGWSIYRGGPSDLNATVEAYAALKLAGLPAGEPAMVRARERALALGGIPRTRVFTRVWLALLGQYDWARLPVLPPEIMFLPQSSSLNVYRFACWARETVVAMTILSALRPVRPVPAAAAIHELYPSGAAAPSLGSRRLVTTGAAFSVLDRLLGAYEGLSLKPGRSRALAAAEHWVLEHQEVDGSWGGIQPPWVYSLMALNALGYPVSHPVIVRGLEGFERFGVTDEHGWWLQSCVSPVWDTALTLIALSDAGLSETHPALVRAVEWLVDKQILTGGDWQVRRPHLAPGGWAFEFHNSLYPDTDDTAVVLQALGRARLRSDERRMRAIERGFRWLLGMQSSNGGWASFDVDNTRRLVTEIPFCDFGEVIDPPSEDVTAHVLEYLGGVGYDRAFPPLQRAVAYLRGAQRTDGAWFGRWGVNYLYGTGAVLAGLCAVGEPPRSEWVARAARWLTEQQNEDGGWGESCASYRELASEPPAPSTASQTAWALLGLLAADGARSPCVRRGVGFLVGRQSADGTWAEPEFTGTGFPRDFFLRYDAYRNVFPLMALGRYRAARAGSG